jgi:hypothetical protein
LLVSCGEDEPISCPSRFYCEEDKVIACEQICVAGDCHREETVASDCAAAGMAINVGKTCGAPGQCIDALREPCNEVGSITCATVETAYRVCASSASGMLWDSRPISQLCMAGQLCHPAEKGAVCYTPPAVPCAGPTSSTCDIDNVTVVRCDGTTSAGFIETRFRCSGMCGLDLNGNATCL